MNELRKVQKVGRNTLTVSIPVEFVKHLETSSGGQPHGHGGGRRDTEARSDGQKPEDE